MYSLSRKEEEQSKYANASLNSYRASEIPSFDSLKVLNQRKLYCVLLLGIMFAVNLPFLSQYFPSSKGKSIIVFVER